MQSLDFLDATDAPVMRMFKLAPNADGSVRSDAIIHFPVWTFSDLKVLVAELREKEVTELMTQIDSQPFKAATPISPASGITAEGRAYMITKARNEPTGPYQAHIYSRSIDGVERVLKTSLKKNGLNDIEVAKVFDWLTLRLSFNAQQDLSAEIIHIIEREPTPPPVPMNSQQAKQAGIGFGEPLPNVPTTTAKISQPQGFGEPIRP